jgi:hypothetical protein
MLDGASHTNDATGESVSSVSSGDDTMAKIRAAIARAPQGPPLSDAMRARVERNRSRGYPGIPGEDFMARLAALPDE